MVIVLYCKHYKSLGDRGFKTFRIHVKSIDTFFDFQSIENNWRTGQHVLQRINCRSENSKGVYCLQYDDHKIVSGLRDNTIKIWDRNTLQCVKV